jgi:hypothetical protein
MSTAVPDELERRPMVTSRPVNGTTVGAPPVGQTPAACCAAKKSGSIHISATQSAPARVAVAAGAGAEGVLGTGLAGGLCPVVKSYPHASQKSASAAF